jgi:hypothetical protein
MRCTCACRPEAEKRKWIHNLVAVADADESGDISFLELKKALVLVQPRHERFCVQIPGYAPIEDVAFDDASVAAIPLRPLPQPGLWGSEGSAAAAAGVDAAAAAGAGAGAASSSFSSSRAQEAADEEKAARAAMATIESKVERFHIELARKATTNQQLVFEKLFHPSYGNCVTLRSNIAVRNMSNEKVALVVTPDGSHPPPNSMAPDAIVDPGGKYVVPLQTVPAGRTNAAPSYVSIRQLNEQEWSDCLKLHPDQAISTTKVQQALKNDGEAFAEANETARDLWLQRRLDGHPVCLRRQLLASVSTTTGQQGAGGLYKLHVDPHKVLHESAWDKVRRRMRECEPGKTVFYEVCVVENQVVVVTRFLKHISIQHCSVLYSKPVTRSPGSSASTRTGGPATGPASTPSTSPTGTTRATTAGCTRAKTSGTAGRRCPPVASCRSRARSRAVSSKSRGGARSSSSRRASPTSPSRQAGTGSTPSACRTPS